MHHSPPDEKYDLKGSWIDRHTNNTVEAKKLMKDEDLHRILRLSPRKSATLYAQVMYTHTSMHALTSHIGSRLVELWILSYAFLS